MIWTVSGQETEYAVGREERRARSSPEEEAKRVVTERKSRRKEGSRKARKSEGQGPRRRRLNGTLHLGDDARTAVKSILNQWPNPRDGEPSPSRSFNGGGWTGGGVGACNIFAAMDCVLAERSHKRLSTPSAPFPKRLGSIKGPPIPTLQSRGRILESAWGH